MTEYKELQIVKHALQHYIQREGADPDDIETEKRLLKEIERRIEWRREKYELPSPDETRRAAIRATDAFRALKKSVEIVAEAPDGTPTEVHVRSGPSWVDDADTYLCPYCRYEHHNPNLLPGKGKYCPHCKNRVRWDI